MTEPHRRPGTKVVYILKDGENAWLGRNGDTVVCHPDNPPFIITADGKRVELTLAGVIEHG